MVLDALYEASIGRDELTYTNESSYNVERKSREERLYTLFLRPVGGRAGCTQVST